MKKTILVPFEEHHLRKVLDWVNDKKVHEYIGTVRPISMFEHTEWYGKLMQDKSRLYLIIQNGEWAVGAVGLNGIDLIYRNAECWIFIGENDARKKGIGREAMRQLYEIAFNRLGLHRIYAYVFEYNKEALTFFRKCGMVEEGRLREAAFKRGKFVDKIIMGILEGEFRKTTRPEK